MLDRNFRGEIIRMPHDFLEGPISAERIRFWLNLRRDLRCLAGHRFTLDLPFTDDDVKIVALAFVREPIARIYSEYRYLKIDGIPDAGNLASNSDSFEAFIKSLCDRDDDGLVGYSQFWHLTNGTQFGRTEVERLVAEGRLQLFPVKRIEDACLVLESVFPDDFRDASTLSLNQNRAKSDDRNLSSDLQRLLRERLADDFWMHELAERSVSTKLDQIGSAQKGKLIKSLNRRKAVRRLVKYPVQRIVHRLSSYLSQW